MKTFHYVLGGLAALGLLALLHKKERFIGDRVRTGDIVTAPLQSVRGAGNPDVSGLNLSPQTLLIFQVTDGTGTDIIRGELAGYKTKSSERGTPLAFQLPMLFTIARADVYSID